MHFLNPNYNLKAFFQGNLEQKQFKAQKNVNYKNPQKKNFLDS